MGPELGELLDEARRLAHQAQPPGLTIYLPGMFEAYGRRGRYPAVSITGPHCGRACLHCAGRLLAPMHPATTPAELLALGRRLADGGQAGLLLSGGGDEHGRLPWRAMLPAIAELSASTNLVITAHVGRVDADLARQIKAAGVRQALIDVVGSADTAREILRLPDGLAGQEETLAACAAAGLEVVPHIILGLHGGQMRGEHAALEMVAGLKPTRVVLVVFMPLKRTPLAGAAPLPVGEAARFIAQARLRLPRASHHLGCARPRGRYRHALDALAVRAGINALAIPSDGALAAAQDLGLPVDFRDTCCSLG
ncbi:MAG: radical SAM protein [Desulfarculus sp.]|nr:radical SAM protein [Desulfarculus sp.]